MRTLHIWVASGLAVKGWETGRYLDELVGVLAEHLRVLLHLLLVAVLGGFDQDQQGDVGLQEGVGDVVHHSFTELENKENSFQ